MRITIRNLRKLIRETLVESGGGTSIGSRPTTNNPAVSSIADREQIGRISIQDIDDPDMIAPHLMEPDYDREETEGPVPPTGKHPYASPDPLAKDFNVIPTSTIRR